MLLERLEAGSQPGARRDGHRVALVLEGGGMRGVVSAGMTAALERLGLTPCFDLVVGSSAGAINGGADRRGRARGRGDRLRAARVTLVREPGARASRPAGDRRELDPQLLLLASSRMPWAGGAPVAIDGRRYVDGGLAAAVPVAEAVAAGATHVLALQTRPQGIPRKSASRIGDRLIERHLRTLNPARVTAYRDRVAGYERLVEDIARWSREGGEPPYVLGIRPGAGTPVVSQLERRATVLSVAAADAERLVEAALRLGAVAA